MLKQEQPDCFEVKRSCPTFYARRLFSGASVKWWGTGSNLDFCSLSPRTRSLSNYISQNLTLSVARMSCCAHEYSFLWLTQTNAARFLATNASIVIGGRPLICAATEFVSAKIPSCNSTATARQCSLKRAVWPIDSAKASTLAC
jgi:hypothetical protein